MKSAVPYQMIYTVLITVNLLCFFSHTLLPLTPQKQVAKHPVPKGYHFHERLSEIIRHTHTHTETQTHTDTQTQTHTQTHTHTHTHKGLTAEAVCTKQ